jgi:hypothetical protein
MVGGMNEPWSWEELERPVLRWVYECGWARTGQLDHLVDKPSSILPHLNDRQFDEALRRLLDHGLVIGRRKEALVVWWDNVRVTANGLRVLGEWPPLEAAMVNVTLARVLRALAGDLDEEDATAAKRAGSALAKMSGEVVLDIVTDRVQELGGDLLS